MADKIAPASTVIFFLRIITLTYDSLRKSRRLRTESYIYHGGQYIATGCGILRYIRLVVELGRKIPSDIHYSGKSYWGVGMKKKLHNCGDGFKGHIVKARGVAFCGFCGKEFRK